MNSCLRCFVTPVLLPFARLGHELTVPLPSKADPIACIMPLDLSTGEVLLGLCLRRGHAGLSEAANFCLFTAHSLLLFSSVRSHLAGCTQALSTLLLLLFCLFSWGSVLLLVCFPFHLFGFCCCCFFLEMVSSRRSTCLYFPRVRIKCCTTRPCPRLVGF